MKAPATDRPFYASNINELIGLERPPEFLLFEDRYTDDGTVISPTFFFNVEALQEYVAARLDKRFHVVALSPARVIIKTTVEVKT